MTGPSVPWNAAWTGENRGFEIRPCRFVQNRLAIWQPHAPGEGKPMFAEPHIVRQRRSIAEMRCTVCGERTPSTDRWWFEHGIVHEGWFMTTESPVHRACADHSLHVCPHLRARGLSPTRFPDQPIVMAATVRQDSILMLFGIFSDRQVIGQLKLAFPVSRIRRRIIERCAAGENA